MIIIPLQSEKAFWRYDKGYTVVSKPLSYSSHRPRASHTYAHWYVQAIGDPTVVGGQELGVPDLSDRTRGRLQAPLSRGQNQIYVEILDGKLPRAEWEAGARSAVVGHIQGFGRVEAVASEGRFLLVTLERRSEYYFPVGTYFYFYPPGVVPSDNLFLPRRSRVAVRYDAERDAGRLRPAPVMVFRRNTRRGKASFFYADRVAALEQGQAAELDAGYYAFASYHPLREVVVEYEGVSYTHWYNEAAAPFEIAVAGGEPGHLLRAGVTCRNAPQPADRRSAPGESVLCLEGVPLVCDDGREVATRGDIYVCGEGENAFVAWNDFGYDDATRSIFSQCKLGRVERGRVTKLGVDRWGPSWYTRPTFELLGGFVKAGGEYFGGRVRRLRRWVPTRLRVVWAAPPQENLPEGYDGGCAAVVMVPGDWTAILTVGRRFRLGTLAEGDAAPKEYVISEVTSALVSIASNSPFALDDTWRGVTAVFTRAVVLEVSLGLDDYAQRVRTELLGKYVFVDGGGKNRYEVWRYRP